MPTRLLAGNVLSWTGLHFVTVATKDVMREGKSKREWKMDKMWKRRDKDFLIIFDPFVTLHSIIHLSVFSIYVLIIPPSSLHQSLYFIFSRRGGWRRKELFKPIKSNMHICAEQNKCVKIKSYFLFKDCRCNRKHILTSSWLLYVSEDTPNILYVK